MKTCDGYRNKFIGDFVNRFVGRVRRRFMVRIFYLFLGKSAFSGLWEIHIGKNRRLVGKILRRSERGLRVMSRRRGEVLIRA